MRARGVGGQEKSVSRDSRALLKELSHPSSADLASSSKEGVTDPAPRPQKRSRDEATGEGGHKEQGLSARLLQEVS